MADLLLLGAVLTAMAGIAWLTHTGPRLREHLVTARAERAVRRRHLRVGRSVSTGILGIGAERARHNDFDHECRFWFADRRPEANDTANRDFGGASAGLAERRCLICRPYPDVDADALLDPSLETS